MKKYLMAAALLAAASAHAHITLEQTSAPAGSYQKLVFRVGHGCSGSPTTAVSIRLPEGLAALRPMPKAGWNIERTPDSLSWRGGPLPDDFYEEFVMFGKLPAAGSHTFKIVQSCQAGSANWETTLETR
ncbi:YcnI family protein [Pseudoduganella violaceinigra]|uniref:YcnI family protein n=1 Tax=Pseudoduganella violaceinigra TaxID=246602 RepID=UPI0003F9A0B4|nr:YcnI family protein [Pseudoduganella violaceinigra]